MTRNPNKSSRMKPHSLRTRMQAFLVTAIISTLTRFSTVKASSTSCLAGRFWNGADCQDCEIGQYQIQDGQTSCVKCEAGKFSDAGTQQTSDICKPCQAGTYQTITAQTSCIECEAGKFSDAGTAPAARLAALVNMLSQKRQQIVQFAS